MQSVAKKNSKKGFSLPVAMGVGIFLVIIASSLMFITIGSISRTSANISSRQAYLNVKSALRYAQAYYSDNVSNYADVDKEFMYMNDTSGGTTDDGATLTKKASEAEAALTYVEARYYPAENKNPATLKLMGTARYTDAYSRQPNSVKLNITFTVGGSGPNRLTVIAAKSHGFTEKTGETITLNVRQPKDMGFILSYYVWTYKDSGHFYDSFNSSTDNSYTYDEKFKNDGNMRNKLSSTLSSGNYLMPNGTWAKGDKGKTGPPAIMGKGSNDWYMGDYVVKSGRVPWFNIIFAQKGSILGTGDANIENSQTCEMLHLWYLDPTDKNIYFEFQEKGTRSYWTKYYLNNDWNGKKYLEDQILVYVKNTKTTVHFRASDYDKNSVTPGAGRSAQITSLSNCDGTAIDGKFTNGTSTLGAGQMMEYEGCGWWVATVDTGRLFNIGITFNNGTSSAEYKAQSVDRSSSNSDVYLILRKGATSLESSLTEQMALSKLGEGINEYVTVHAKVYDHNNGADPVLGYSNVSNNSTAGMIDLQDTIIRVSGVSKSDYVKKDDEGNYIESGAEYDQWVKYEDAFDAGISALNEGEAFITKQEGADIEAKRKNADEAYRKLAQDILDARDKLIQIGMDGNALTNLELVVEEADIIIEDQEAATSAGLDPVYDIPKYQHFVRDGGEYDNAKQAIANKDNVSNSVADAYATALRTAIDEMYLNKLDKSVLQGLVTEAQDLVENIKYPEDKRNELKTELDEANPASAISVLNNTTSTQNAINEAVTNIQTKINNVYNSINSLLDSAELESNVITANNYIDNVKNGTTVKDYTDTTYQNLVDAVDKAVKEGSKATDQKVIDQLNNELVAAIDAFTVRKPEKTNGELGANHHIRLWMAPNAAVTDARIYLYTSEESTEHETHSMITLSYQPSNRYYYEDIDTNIHEYVQFDVIYKEGGATSTVLSDKYSLKDITDNNVVFKFDEIGETSQNKFITIYTDIPGTTVTAFLYNSKNQATSPVMQSNSEGSYKAFRFIADENKNNNNVKITSETGNVYLTLDSKYDYDYKKLEIGEYVILSTGEGTAGEPIKVNDIYPKYAAAPSDPDNPEPTVSTGYDFSIQDLSAGASAYAGIETVTKAFDVSVPDGKTALIVHVPDSLKDAITSGDFANAPLLWAWGWNPSSKTEPTVYGGGAFPGQKMTRYGISSYYYAIVDNNIAGIVISNSVTNNKYNTSDYYFKSYTKPGSSTMTSGKPGSGTYKYLLCEPTSPTDHNTTAYPSDAPVITVPQMVYDATMNLKMVYVGGNKVRVINKSYAKIFGEGKITHDYGTGITSSHPFGVGGNGNTHDGRTGGSQLVPYYDWYEYKLPVSKQADYTFQIMGMNRSAATVATRSLNNVYGDVWLEQLDNSTLSDSCYSNVNVYTFNPDETLISENIYVYFRKYKNFDQIKLNAHGVKDVVDLAPEGALSRASNANIYKFKLTKKSPFITFSCREKLSDGTYTYHTYKTYLHGGNTVLFDPKLRNNNGDWTDFVSDQDKLKNALTDCMNLYYGETIIKEYNSSGLVVDHGSSTYNYPEYLLTLFSGYCNYTNSNGVRYYTLNDVSGYSDSVAYAAATNISSWVSKYHDLFEQMGSAKELLEYPLTNSEMSSYGQSQIHTNSTSGRYPDYLSAVKTGTKYTDASLKVIRQRLAEAEGAYISSNSSNIATATINLKRALSVKDVESEYSVACVLYDAQGKLKKGSTFSISYDIDMGGATGVVHKEELVKERNPEGFPIIFVSLPATGSTNKITNVQFNEFGTGVPYTEGGGLPLGTARTEMKRDEAWVFVDQASNCYWSPNSTSDYRQVSSDIYVKDSDSDTMVFEMKKKDGKFEPMTLLFANNAEVKVKNLSGEYDPLYTIKAGAYYFTNEDANNSSSVAYGGKIDMFSEKAIAYFSDPANYGAYTTNYKSANALGWIIKDGTYTNDDGIVVNKYNFKTLRNTATGNVNFEATEGTFRKYVSNYQYCATNGLYFRWNPSTPLYTTTNVILQANEIRFASSGTVDGTYDLARNPHFYFMSNSSTADSMTVTFLTDVAVRYYDEIFEEHTFVIREGEYTIRRKTPGTEFIADLYDETYWIGREFIEYKGRGAGENFTSGPEGGSLKGGSFS